MKKQKGKKNGVTVNYCRPYDKESRRNFAGLRRKDQRKTNQKRVIDYELEYEIANDQGV